MTRALRMDPFNAPRMYNKDLPKKKLANRPPNQHEIIKNYPGLGQYRTWFKRGSRREGFFFKHSLIRTMSNEHLTEAIRSVGIAMETAPHAESIKNSGYPVFNTGPYARTMPTIEECEQVLEYLYAEINRRVNRGKP